MTGDKPQVGWDLLVSTGTGKRRTTATMMGTTGEDAARRYVDLHRDATVWAYRRHQEPITVLGRGRIEG